MSIAPAGVALQPLEVASGFVFGLAASDRAPLTPAGHPRATVERAVLPALLRPPCFVAFSGGRASSLVLRASVALARREGLEVPVPVTVQRRGRRAEHVGQERLVIRLGLTEWLRVPFGDELDPVGPVAMAALRRYGVLWPADAHVLSPLVAWAFGGSLITGIGHHDSGRYRARALAGDAGLLPWLRPGARREVRRRLRADGRSFRRAEQSPGTPLPRGLALQVDLLARIAADSRVEMCHPLLHPALARALSCLTPTPLERATSVVAGWSSFSRRAVAAWRGEGVDPDVVDVAALRREWSRRDPDPRTLLLLQSVALARPRLAVRGVAALAGR